MNNFVIYCHINNINGKKYIGLTSMNPPSKRWGSNGINYKSCTYFYNAIQKYGWDNFIHKILLTGLTEQQARRIESEFIKYQSTLAPNGYNLKLNNDKEYIISEETKQKMRNAQLGKKISTVSRQKMSETRKGHIGYNRKAIWMCDKQTHQPIKFFSSMTEAEQFLKNSKAHTHISKVCHGKEISAYGYFWKFAKKEEN